MQDGFLTVSVIDSSTNRPIQNASVNIYGLDEEYNNTGIVYSDLQTNESGQVTNLTLEAPDIVYSLEPSDVKPYSEYIVEVTSEGYDTVIINGSQILPTETALQGIPMTPLNRKKGSRKRQSEDIYDISAHTLWGNFPPKIPESSLKPLPPPTGFVVLDEPVVPEFIVVHDGLPENTSAQNYWVLF